MTPQELKSVLQAGLLSFPLTDFDAALRFAPAAYALRVTIIDKTSGKSVTRSVPFTVS